VQARGHVVVVEDDDAIKVLIQDILEEEGYVCLAESSANAGLELVERVQPDVLILDIVLGGTASGWRLLEQLGRNPFTAAVSTIVCSADAHALSAHEPELREPAATTAPAKPAAAPAASPSPVSSPSPAASPAAKPAASPAASPSPAAALASPSPVATGRVVNFDATEYSFTLPDSLAAGQVTFVMRNTGKELHHAQLLKLNSNVTIEQFMTALQQGEGPALALVSQTGGTGVLDPGPNSEEVTLDLQPGTYVVACFVLGPDGIPHVVKGMIKPLTVTAAAAGATTLSPNAPVVVTLRDFIFESPDTIPSGRNTWRITNAGPQPHEIQVARLSQGGSAQDVLRFFTTPPAGPPPYQSVGGFQGIDAGGSGFLTLSLTAGDYAFYCAIPDLNTGKRHLEEGMLKQVSIR